MERILQQQRWRRIKHRLILFVIPCLAILWASVVVISASADSVAKGASMRQLAQCPDSPNCVCTQSTDPNSQMDPIAYQGTYEQAKNRLLSIIQHLPRTRIVEQDDDYLHLECRSLIFRFVDDVEFLIDHEQNQIHFRSASRTGYSDLGVNRQRMLQITDMFQVASETQSSE